MTTWWRSNRWFLLALAVLIPVAAVVALMPRFLPYLDAQPRIEHVGRGDAVRYGGADFQLAGLVVLDGATVDAPAGADVVVVTVAVDVVDPQDAYCDVDLVSDESGWERVWWPGSDAGDLQVRDPFESSCDLSEERSFLLQQLFVVPHGEVTAPALEITTFDESPRVVRLH